MYGTDARPVPPITSVSDDNFVYDLSVFVLDTPGNREIIQASGSLPDPWAVSPLCGSHRAVSRRKSHYAVWIFAVIRGLPGSYRPAAALVIRPSSRSLLMWLLITGSYLMNVYSVVKVLCLLVPVTTRLLRVNCNWNTAVSTVTGSARKGALLVHFFC